MTPGSLQALELAGGLTVNGPAEFRGETLFTAFTQFIDRVIFGKDVEFAGRVTFNQDTAGYAIVKEGETDVVVTFDQEYAVTPVVNASLSLQPIENAEVRRATEELLLVSDVRYIITHVTTTGFEIRIAEGAQMDVPFSWQAIAVKDAKTSEESSLGGAAAKESEPVVTPVPEETPPAIVADTPEIPVSDTLPPVSPSEASSLDPSTPVSDPAVVSTETPPDGTL